MYLPVNRSLIVVLLQLLKTTSSRPDQSFAVVTEQCFNEGTMITYECEVPAVYGILFWNGVGFDCPSDSSISNNVLALPTSPCPLVHGMEHTGKCGPYSANLICMHTEDFEYYLISAITFVSNHEMNGSFISCQFLGHIEIFPIRVGVTPNPPLRVRVITRKDRSCRFDWTPPNESIGGIGGYKIRYGDNCDNCNPAPGFVNQTEVLTAECNACIEENNNMCYFEVNAVSEDCWFDSLPVEATSNSPINSPNGSTVSITCSLTTSNPPPIYVEWIYAFSEESRRAFSGFLVTISDQSNHTVLDTLLDSKVRTKYVNSTLLREDYGLVGDIWNITVEVMALEEENKFAYDSIEFSVEDTIMLDPSSAVTPDQCIEVSINSHCDERSDIFQAQVQFNKGSCESDPELTNSTNNYTMQDGYKTCVPVVAGTICYSTVIFHNELELGRTERQELILLPCILKTSNSTRVNINSTNGEIPRGIEMIPHNTTLNLSCDFNCTLDQNQTRCANGTFQPSISPILRDGCHCSDSFEDPQYIIIAYILGPVGGIVLLVVVVHIIAGCIIIYWKKNRQSEKLTTDAVSGGKLEMSVNNS